MIFIYKRFFVNISVPETEKSPEGIHPPGFMAFPE